MILPLHPKNCQFKNRCKSCDFEVEAAAATVAILMGLDGPTGVICPKYVGWMPREELKRIAQELEAVKQGEDDDARKSGHDCAFDGYNG